RLSFSIGAKLNAPTTRFTVHNLREKVSGRTVWPQDLFDMIGLSLSSRPNKPHNTGFHFRRTLTGTGKKANHLPPFGRHAGISGLHQGFDPRFKIFRRLTKPINAIDMNALALQKIRHSFIEETNRTARRLDLDLIVDVQRN